MHAVRMIAEQIAATIQSVKRVTSHCCFIICYSLLTYMKKTVEIKSIIHCIDDTILKKPYGQHDIQIS